MSSRRAIRRRKCGRKQKHDTLETALQAAVRLHRAKGGEWLQAYRCRFCKKWHIGHR